MEGEKENCSTFYVPGSMSDVTLVSTPLPQAASTASKRRSEMEEEEEPYMVRRLREFDKGLDAYCQPSSPPYNHGKTSESKYWPSSGGLSSTQLQGLSKMSERLMNAGGEPAKQPNNADPYVSDYYRRIPSAPVPNYCYPSSYYPSDPIPNSFNPIGTETNYSYPTTDFQKNRSSKVSNIITAKISPESVCNQSNSETNSGRNFNADSQKPKSPRRSDFDTAKLLSVPVPSKSSSGTDTKNKSNEESQKPKSPRISDIDTAKLLSVPVPNKINSETDTRNKSNASEQKGKSPSRSDIDSAKLLSVPELSKSSSGTDTRNNSNSGEQEGKPPRSSQIDEVKITSVPSSSSRISDNFSKVDNLGIGTDKSALPAGLTKYRSTRHLAQWQDDHVSVASAINSSTGVILPEVTQHRDDRFSLASSANSSFGVLPREVLDEAFNEPLVDVNQDLSLRLAQNLNLDTSLLKGGLDISTLASERYKEKVAAKCEDNKENQRNSGRSSSDYWTIHGYSSDNSDCRNNTAKRLSSLSSASGDEKESFKKSSSSPRRFLRPLSEMNFITPHSVSNSQSGRSSLSSNQFGSYSNISVNSEDFQFDEDPVQRFERDEREFSMASTRSLSGIYGDTNPSVNVNGQKLSMSSFLRSGSYPLGSLETGANDLQSPQFGMPAKSPEKTGKPRAILPIPQDKSTFVIEEEPVRDTPWAPQSLMEQYSNIHNSCTNMTDADTSVPSLSYIGEMLEKLQQGANPKEVLAQLMAPEIKTNNKRDMSLKPHSISSVVEGENSSFCQGIEAEHSFSAKDKSGLQLSNTQAPRDESVCNVTDFEGDEDACVCVMTPQSMDFEIFNELSHPVEYTFAKACYVDGQRKDSAAYVHFPVSKLMLYPGQKRIFTIYIAALIGGEIKIKIEVARRNPVTKARECSNVYGKIVAEIPRVSLLSQHKCEMIPNPDCEYDGKYQHTIIMKNEGRSSVPLKLTVTKMADDEVEFHFGEREKRTVTVTVEPGQMFKQLVQCETPPVFAHLRSPETIIAVKATVEFCLATTDLYQLNPIAPVTLVAPLKPYFFSAPSMLVVPTLFSLYNSCDHPVVFKTVIASGYTVHPPSFTIPPKGTFEVTINTADVKNPLRHGDLTLRVHYPMGSESRFTIQLREDRQSSLSSNNSLVTPHGSRATSPTSPSGRHKGPVGELKLVCSQNQLVWGGCHLHQKVIKTFCLKNMGRQREKLRLTISDQCFKIVGEEDKLQSEFKLSLQPMENREIKVAVLATVTGPQWGHLSVSRISCATDKNVLPLFAFGGKPKVNLTDGVCEIEANKYLFLDEHNLQGSFALSNSGDNAAFFKISDANFKSSAGLSISPQESLLAAGRTVTVHISLSVTAQRLEYLLRQPVPSVCVAQISICWGDESTRQRLLQMRGLHGVLAARVAQLSRIPSCPITNLDKLDSSVSSAEKLWEEDTDEWTVRIFVKRSALEALRLDTSEDFVDLSKTVSKPQH